MFGQQRCKYTQPNLSSSAPETTAQEHESFQKLPNRNRKTEALSLTPTHGRHIFFQSRWGKACSKLPADGAGDGGPENRLTFAKTSTK